MTICIDSDGYLIVGNFALPAVLVNQARKFLQHERDEELGRWRWPKNPNYVVYGNVIDPARRQARGVTVVSETIPRTYTVWEDNVDVLYGASANEESRQDARSAARAYFDAHPERKPWHDAEAGDSWVVRTDRNPRGLVYLVVQTDEPLHRWFIRPMVQGDVQNLELSSPTITGARRIWPTDSKTNE